MALSPETKSRLFRFAGRSAARLVALVRDTSEIVVEPADAMVLIKANHPFIFAMWHGQFMMEPALHKGEIAVSAIAARHGDAEIVAELLSRFNIELVRGAGANERAKDRGGAHALRMALKLLKSGSTFAMTADVPPGPARKAGVGIVTLARMSGRPILPFASATSRYIALKTWSRMTINLPYGRLAYAIGPPIFVPHDLSEAQVEEYRLKIEDALNAVTQRAYELAGADPKRATPPKVLMAASTRPADGFRIRAYRAVTSLLRPAAPLLLKVRERQGKEDPERRSERYGLSSIPRPGGPVAWVHAASVGETNAVLPLMDRLVALCPGLTFVFTTGTLTSAGLAKRRLPPGSIHQFVPLDSAQYANNFLDHWRPDLAIFTESEIWPNLIVETSARGIPLALVNARMSARSHARWGKSPGLAAPLFGRFDIILTQNERFKRVFRGIGGRNVVTAGNLKIDAPPPPVDAEELARLQAALAGRPVFVAASTHTGEDEVVAAAHQRIAASLPGLCTIIAPRHPERGAAIANMLRSAGLAVAQRSQGEPLTAETHIYVADTIGELGTFYALAPVAFIGGSLVAHGGQNPIEAIAHGAAVLTGPHWTNFRDAYRTLLRHNGAAEVTSADDLAAAVTRLLASEAEREVMCAGARAAMLTLGGALDRTANSLAPYLPKPEGLRRAS